MNLLDDFKCRGIIQDISNERAVAHYLSREGNAVYAGYDPTAESLHVGNLLPLLTQIRMMRAGLDVVFLMGGATGLIGDPSGKDQERSLSEKELVHSRAGRIRRQVEGVVARNTDKLPTVVNNYDWIRNLSAIGLLRDVGKFFSVNRMLEKESVRGRIDREATGISYTEFSYMLLQAFDYYHLFKTRGCLLQIGGGDQWGNITAGCELIRRKCAAEEGRQVEAYAMTLPLITTASGKKFGKSEGNAVWLDREKTSEYAFHQFWLNTDDKDVTRFLKLFTFLDWDEIRELDASVRNEAHLRRAQRRLADEVTRIVHGENALRAVREAGCALFGEGDLVGLGVETLRGVMASAPSLVVTGAMERDLCHVLVDLGMCASRGQARRLVEEGGVYVNNRRVTDASFVPGDRDFLHGEILVVRKGKKQHGVVRRLAA